jgi:very-short-patch-repair endonuclease
MQKKYGCKNPSQSSVIREKVKKTCIDHFGETTNLKTEETKNKIKKTCFEKYGSTWTNNHKECRDKIKNTCLLRYGVESWSQTEAGKKTFREIRSKVLMLNCGPFSGFLENNFFDEINKRFPNIIIERQKYIDGYWIDGYVEKLNIVIEFDENYHKAKWTKQKDEERQVYISNKLKCIFFRVCEDQWKTEKNNVLNELDKLFIESKNK